MRWGRVGLQCAITESKNCFILWPHFVLKKIVCENHWIVWYGSILKIVHCPRKHIHTYTQRCSLEHCSFLQMIALVCVWKSIGSDWFSEPLLGGKKNWVLLSVQEYYLTAPWFKNSYATSYKGKLQRRAGEICGTWLWSEDQLDKDCK